MTAAPDLNLNESFNTSTPGNLPTSTFPYQSVGPVDFSQLNFVKTKQVDYYYDTVGSSSAQILVSTVEQDYDPTETMLAIAGLIILFFLALSWGVAKVRKMGK